MCSSSSLLGLWLCTATVAEAPWRRHISATDAEHISATVAEAHLSHRGGGTVAEAHLSRRTVSLEAAGNISWHASWHASGASMDIETTSWHAC